MKFLFQTLILLLFLYSKSLAQNFVENNLPDKTPNKAKSSENINDSLNKSLGVKNNKTQNLQDINTSKNDLVNTLLGVAKPVSLMFTDNELGDINRALDSLKNDQAYIPDQLDKDKNGDKKLRNETNEKSYIYLASIIYYTSKDWVVWINNNKITSDNNKFGKELFIKRIDSEHATIVWSIGVTKWKILTGKKSEELAPKINANNNVEIEFTLKPNQTYILGQNRVVEGRAVLNQARNKNNNINNGSKKNLVNKKIADLDEKKEITR